MRAALNGTPLVHLNQAAGALRALDLARLKSYGAVAVTIRQADRLRPYLALTTLVEADPTAMSRIVVYLDSRQEFLLNSRDRAVVRALPAHLSGEMASRSRIWATEHRSELSELLTVASKMRGGKETSTPEASSWARRGIEMEIELARHVRPMAD